jgi:hypothetical protein
MPRYSEYKQAKIAAKEHADHVLAPLALRQGNICVEIEHIEHRIHTLEALRSRVEAKPYDDATALQYMLSQVQKRIPGIEFVTVYAWGSKWFGEASFDSDFDYLAVVRNYAQPAVDNVMQLGLHFAGDVSRSHADRSKVMRSTLRCAKNHIGFVCFHRTCCGRFRLCSTRRVGSSCNTQSIAFRCAFSCCGAKRL